MQDSEKTDMNAIKKRIKGLNIQPPWQDAETGLKAKCPRGLPSVACVDRVNGLDKYNGILYQAL